LLHIKICTLFLFIYKFILYCDSWVLYDKLGSNFFVKFIKKNWGTRTVQLSYGSLFFTKCPESTRKRQGSFWTSSVSRHVC